MPKQRKQRPRSQEKLPFSFQSLAKSAFSLAAPLGDADTTHERAECPPSKGFPAAGRRQPCPCSRAAPAPSPASSCVWEGWCPLPTPPGWGGVKLRSPQRPVVPRWGSSPSSDGALLSYQGHVPLRLSQEEKATGHARHLAVYTKGRARCVLTWSCSLSATPQSS